jgi:protein TonB
MKSPRLLLLAAFSTLSCFSTSSALLATGEDRLQIEIFDVIKVDQMPVVKSRATPVYPFEMRRKKIEGDVVVDFIVTTEGNVVNAFAARSSRVDFEATAINAVCKWKFAPGMKNGRPVNTHMQVPIVFSLNKK